MLVTCLSAYVIMEDLKVLFVCDSPKSKPMFFVVTLKIYEIDLSKSKPEAMMFENVYSPAEENV